MVFIVHVVGMKSLFILDSNLETAYQMDLLREEVWPQNSAESALVTEPEDPLIVYSMAVNCMYSGYMISLIVMNGVSHGGLFKASWPPGETEPKERLPWLLNCFYTIVKQWKTKRPPGLNLLKRGMSHKDNRRNHRNVLHPVQWRIKKKPYSSSTNSGLFF